MCVCKFLNGTAVSQEKAKENTGITCCLPQVYRPGVWTREGGGWGAGGLHYWQISPYFISLQQMAQPKLQWQREEECYAKRKTSQYCFLSNSNTAQRRDEAERVQEVRTWSFIRATTSTEHLARSGPCASPSNASVHESRSCSQGMSGLRGAVAGKRSMIIRWLCIDTEFFTTWYGSLRDRDTNPTWGHEESFPEVRGEADSRQKAWKC